MYFGWRSIFQGVGIMTIAAAIQLASGGQSEGLKLLSVVFVPISILVMLSLLLRNDRVTVDAASSSPLKGEVNTWERWFLLSYFINQISNAMAATLVVFYIDHVLKLTEWTGVFLGFLFFSTMVSVPLWNHLSRYFPLVPLYICAILLAGCVFLIVPFLNAGDFWLYLFVCISAGTLFGADAVLPPSEIERRKRNSGEGVGFSTVFGLKSMLDKAALFLPVIFALPALEFLGFDPAGQNSSSTGLLGLTLLYSVVPVFFKIAAVGLLFFGPGGRPGRPLDNDLKN